MLAHRVTISSWSFTAKTSVFSQAMPMGSLSMLASTFAFHLVIGADVRLRGAVEIVTDRHGAATRRVAARYFMGKTSPANKTMRRRFSFSALKFACKRSRVSAEGTEYQIVIRLGLDKTGEFRREQRQILGDHVYRSSRLQGVVNIEHGQIEVQRSVVGQDDRRW